ncbi:hypothetical protein [Lentibacillus salicampi]|nr:hypothetical protein [Lentibacillus salicampi]
MCKEQDNDISAIQEKRTENSSKKMETAAKQIRNSRNDKIALTNLQEQLD